MNTIERCVGCNAQVEAIEGPIHRYMTSAPACWKRNGELLNVLYARPQNQIVLIMCVDTYAAQHPGNHNPQAIQSVAIHLLNMYGYLVLRRAVKVPQATFSEKAFHAIAPPHLRAMYWLDPAPKFEDALTVFDVPLDGDGDAIAGAARAWAESVWTAWRAHHVKIAQWYAQFALS